MMLTFGRRLIRIRINVLANYSVSVNDLTESNSFIFKSNFTVEEQEKVLNTLNESGPEQLLRFSIPQSRIKNLVNWKIKKGPFRTLSDVLEVDGLGEKVLEKICHQIITEDPKWQETNTSNKNNVGHKRLKQLVTPPFNGNLVNKLQSAVGIHLVPMGISWAKLSREQNKLTDWSYEDLSTLPKKLLPVDNFILATKIIHKLPPADVYILEANPGLSNQGNTQSAAVTSYTQHLELSSMLIALINTSPKHNVELQKIDSNQKNKNFVENKVYHLRSKTPARLFRTLVGTEKVAALNVTSELVDYNKDEFSLPCTPIILEQKIRDAFVRETSANKELLGQALLLIVSFMDLCIYKNPVSLNCLIPNKKKL